MAAVTEAPAPAFVLHRLQRNKAIIPIIGQTPVIPHKWSEKAKRMMLDKQQGKAVAKKAPKEPEQDAHDATYWRRSSRRPKGSGCSSGRSPGLRGYPR